MMITVAAAATYVADIAAHIGAHMAADAAAGAGTAAFASTVPTAVDVATAAEAAAVRYAHSQVYLLAAEQFPAQEASCGASVPYTHISFVAQSRLAIHLPLSQGHFVVPQRTNPTDMATGVTALPANGGALHVVVTMTLITLLSAT